MAQLKDLKNNIDVQASIIPQTAAADIDGAGVDTRGYSSACLAGFIDDAAAGSFVLEESDDNATFTVVSDDEVVTADGTNDTTAVASSVVTIGSLGTKRYIRAKWDNTTGGEVSATIILGNPHVAPTGANS